MKPCGPPEYKEPRDVVAMTYLLTAIFAYGTAVHISHFITNGTNPYPQAPEPIASFFVALVVANPLAAILILKRRRAGLALGVAILVLDAAANAVVNYPPYVIEPGFTAGRIGQAIVSAGALLAILFTLRLWRRFR